MVSCSSYTAMANSECSQNGRRGFSIRKDGDCDDQKRVRVPDDAVVNLWNQSENEQLTLCFGWGLAGAAAAGSGGASLPRPYLLTCFTGLKQGAFIRRPAQS